MSFNYVKLLNRKEQNKATLTAQILIGSTHPNHGGIEPSHYMFLSENSRPAWVLVPQNIFKRTHQSDLKITWIPTVENMLEDAFLMIAIHVLKDKFIVPLADEYFKNKVKERRELYQDIESLKLTELYEKCRIIENNHKIIISVFQGSSILSQLSVIEKYKFDVEVCKTSFLREYLVWSGKTIVNEI